MYIETKKKTCIKEFLCGEKKSLVHFQKDFLKQNSIRWYYTN